MKKWHVGLRLLAIVLSLLLAFPCNLLALTAEKPTTKVKHKSPENYIPGFRVLLDAQIKEEAELLATRCYFKTKHEENFIFVDMVPKSSNTYKSLYQATLPAPWVGSEYIDYVFVVVNEAKKVDRTQMFRINETETAAATTWKEAVEVKEIPLEKAQEAVEQYKAIKKELDKEYKSKLPKNQVADPTGPIEVLTEFEVAPTRLGGFYDNLAVIKVPPAQKFGALAEGLYTEAEIADLGGQTMVADATGAVTGGTIEATGFIGMGTIAIGALALGGLAAAGGGGGGGAGGGKKSSSSLPAGQLLPILTPPNGFQNPPFGIEIVRLGDAVAAPLNLTYEGAPIGNYAGFGDQNFPLPAVGGIARVELAADVTNAIIQFHFNTGGGRRPDLVSGYSITGGAGDYILLQTQ